MKWSETIAFGPALRDVRLLTQTPAQDWTAHLREREEAAFQNGRREGERALNQQLLQQRNEILELQQGVLNSLKQVLPQLIRESESALIQLALASAQKIVAGLPIKAALVEGVVREALSQIEGTTEIVVQLHPDDLALLRKHESPLLTETLENGPIRFTHSAGTTRGGCMLQTRFGIIDARRETKLEQLKKSLST
ncbi:MAG: FliH/SctL family protein [Verrucomicrobiota bacterium]|jgi:flagellar assembly protein FliH